MLTVSERHTQDEDGLFYGEDMLVVRNVPAETVSCVIHNPTLAEEKRSVIDIAGQCPAQISRRGSRGCSKAPHIFYQEKYLTISNMY